MRTINLVNTTRRVIGIIRDRALIVVTTIVRLAKADSHAHAASAPFYFALAKPGAGSSPGQAGVRGMCRGLSHGMPVLGWCRMPALAMATA